MMRLRRDQMDFLGDGEVRGYDDGAHQDVWALMGIYVNRPALPECYMRELEDIARAKIDICTLTVTSAVLSLVGRIKTFRSAVNMVA